MAKKPPGEELFWVSYSSRFSDEGRVHNWSCRYYGNSHGAKVTLKDVHDQTPDCRLCGGAHRDQHARSH